MRGEIMEDLNGIVARNLRAYRSERGINGLDHLTDQLRSKGFSRSMLYRIESNANSTEINQDKILLLAEFFGVPVSCFCESDTEINILFAQVEEAFLRLDYSEVTGEVIELLQRKLYMEKDDGTYIPIGSPRQRILSLMYKGKYHQFNGEMDNAKESYLKALEVAMIARDSKMVHRSRHNVALIFLETGEYSYLFTTLDEDMKDNSYVDSLKAVKNLQLIMNAHKKLRNWKVAEEYALKAIDSCPEHEHAIKGRIYQNLAAIQRELGLASKAQDSVQIALVHTDLVDDHIGTIYALKTLAEIHNDAGMKDDAKKHLERALSISEKYFLKKESLIISFNLLKHEQSSSGYGRMKEIVIALAELGHSPAYMSEKYKTLARLANILGLKEESIEFYEKCISKNGV